jgi:hypothetical protein
LDLGKAWLVLRFDGVISEIMTGVYRYRMPLENGALVWCGSSH